MHSTLARLARSFNRHTRAHRLLTIQRSELRPRSALRKRILPTIVVTHKPTPLPQHQPEHVEIRSTTRSKGFGWSEALGIGRSKDAQNGQRHWLNYPTIQYPDLNSFVRIDLEGYAPVDPSARNPTWAFTADPAAHPTLTDRQYYLLRRLGAAVAFAAKRQTPFVKELLRWIIPAQEFPMLFPLLRPEAWDVLLKQEVGRLPTNFTALVGDIAESCNIPLTEEQTIEYIGGLYWARDPQKAIRRWTVLMASRDPPPSAAAWKLGIKIFALSKEPERARRVYDLMTQTLGYEDPKALIPVMLAWNHLYQKYKAWKLYKKCGKLLSARGESFSESNLSDIALSFLDARSSIHSLWVLKDMLREGFAPPEYTKEAVIIFQNQMQVAEMLHETSTHLAGSLQPAILDKYFYASWIKNLVRLGSADLTLQVKEIMEKKGIQPDSQHLNGMIRGFLKEGNLSAAEALAERMISQRLWNLLSWDKGMREKEARKAAQPLGLRIDTKLPDPTSIPQRPDMENGKKYDSGLQMGNPAEADRQTISLLVIHFARRHKMEKVHHYIGVMLACQIAPGAYTMNHLLNMYLRRSDMGRLAETFENMVTNVGSVPDHETWFIMWFAMWKRYTQKKRNVLSFPTPRAMFRKMVQKIKKQSVYVQNTGQWSKDPKALEIWTLMVRCFIFARDWEGLLIAMNAALTLWKLRVDEGIFKEIALGVRKEGMAGIGRKESGAIGRLPLTRASLREGITELDQLKRTLSVRKKVMRLAPDGQRFINDEWERIKERIRVVPSEEAEAALEAVTRVVLREIDGIGSMSADASGIGLSGLAVEGLRKAREDMLVQDVGLVGILPPASNSSISRMEYR
ncbi:hypothetical protein DFH27DRAFT_575466 [Peziza echinospora]|nr:hypothetical protein DFH27DRAFT_575466 [Peziza echinospora]